jgi:hypothetical protein
MFDRLPLELLTFQIAPELDYLDLLRFKCVCRRSRRSVSEKEERDKFNVSFKRWKKLFVYSIYTLVFSEKGHNEIVLKIQDVGFDFTVTHERVFRRKLKSTCYGVFNYLSKHGIHIYPFWTTTEERKQSKAVTKGLLRIFRKDPIKRDISIAKRGENRGALHNTKSLTISIGASLADSDTATLFSRYSFGMVADKLPKKKNRNLKRELYIASRCPMIDEF